MVNISCQLQVPPIGFKRDDYAAFDQIDIKVGMPIALLWCIANVRVSPPGFILIKLGIHL